MTYHKVLLEKTMIRRISLITALALSLLSFYLHTHNLNEPLNEPLDKPQDANAPQLYVAR
jgi:hypothetical protein